MKKIIYATDFSDISIAKFPMAVKLAEQLKAELLLLHIYKIPSIYKFPYTGYTFNTEHEQTVEASQKLQSIFETHFKVDKPDVKVSTRVVRDSSAARGILSTLETEKADLLVLSALGDNQSHQKIFGNMVPTLIKQSDIPVLTIPKNAIHLGLSNLLFTTNLYASEIFSITQFVKLFRPLNPNIDIIHIHTSKEDDIVQKVEGFKKMLHENVKYSKLSFKEYFAENIYFKLLHLIEDNNYDFLVMTDKGHAGRFYRLFHESLINKLNKKASLPVLSFTQENIKSALTLGKYFPGSELTSMGDSSGDHNSLSHVLTQINNITLDIQTNYPELYQFLDEQPITIPSEGHPHVDAKALSDYLDNLRQLLAHHVDKRQFTIVPTTD